LRTWDGKVLAYVPEKSDFPIQGIHNIYAIDFSKSFNTFAIPAKISSEKVHPSWIFSHVVYEDTNIYISIF
jgi:hypothetical protein